MPSPELVAVQGAVERLSVELIELRSAVGDAPRMAAAGRLQRAARDLATGWGASAPALDSSPVILTTCARSDRTEMHFLDGNQVEALAEAIAHPAARRGGQGAAPWWRTELPEYGLLVRFAAYMGLRAGELEALRVGHSSITVTLNTYGHLLPGLEEALTDADSLLGSRQGDSTPGATDDVAPDLL